jgi:hypothetical protein
MEAIAPRNVTVGMANACIVNHRKVNIGYNILE